MSYPKRILGATSPSFLALFQVLRIKPRSPALTIPAPSSSFDVIVVVVVLVTTVLTEVPG